MSAGARRERRLDTLLQEHVEPLPFSFYNIVKGIGRHPLDMGLGKSLRGLLLLCGNVKVIQRSLFPVNLFDVGDSQLHYIDILAEGSCCYSRKESKYSPHLLLPKLNPGTVGLQMSRSSPFTSDGSIPLPLAGDGPSLSLSSRLI